MLGAVGVYTIQLGEYFINADIIYCLYNYVIKSLQLFFLLLYQITYIIPIKLIMSLRVNTMVERDY